MLKYIHCRYECINDGKSKQKGKFMTKNKSRKMTKSTFAIIIMGIMMVAMLAFGGTFAYFTATATKNSASITTGTVGLQVSQISGDAYTLTMENVVPGDVISSSALTLTTESAGTDLFIAIKVVLTNEDGSLAGNNLADVTKWLNATPYTSATWVRTSTDNVYVLGSGTTAKSVPSAAQVKITPDQIKFEANADWVQGSTKPVLMGASLTITFEARAIQAKNLESTEVDDIADLLVFA